MVQPELADVHVVFSLHGLAGEILERPHTFIRIGDGNEQQSGKNQQSGVAHE
jgi:hypothetical protein